MLVTHTITEKERPAEEKCGWTAGREKKNRGTDSDPRKDTQLIVMGGCLHIWVRRVTKIK